MKMIIELTQEVPNTNEVFVRMKLIEAVQIAGQQAHDDPTEKVGGSGRGLGNSPAWFVWRIEA